MNARVAPQAAARSFAIHTKLRKLASEEALSDQIVSNTDVQIRTMLQEPVESARVMMLHHSLTLYNFREQLCLKANTHIRLRPSCPTY